MADLNDLTQNVNIWNDDKSKAVDVITDGGIERLAVDSKVTGGSVSLARYRPRFFTSKTDITILTTDTTLKSLDFDGQLSAISINTTNKQIEIIIEVDSTEIFRVQMADLNDGSEYRLQIGSDDIHFPIQVDDQGKHFFLRYFNTPPDVLTNLTVKAKSFSGGTETMQSIFIVYREKV